MRTRLVVVGGSDAGISAALGARELDASIDVTVVVADGYPNYSICGLPFYVSGEVEHRHSLAHRTVADLENSGARFLLHHTATAIDPPGRRVTTVNDSGERVEVPYDRLVIATGAVPSRPPVSGLDLPGVFLLHSIESGVRIRKTLAGRLPRSVVIVGAGYIGVEMADAFTRCGVKVILVGRNESVLPAVEPSMGHLLEEELERHDVEVVNGVSVRSIETRGPGLNITGSRGFAREADLVLIAAGVEPSVGLATHAGIATGVAGAIRVDREMRTSDPDVFAAGDCVETWHRVTRSATYLPLGTTAHKQGRVAGENAIGGRRQFGGSVGTQVVKVFDLAVARTGLLHREALDAGFAPLTVESKAWDHKPYYPGATELTFRVTGDRKSGRLLGAQIIGHWKAEVAKRIDIFASALWHDTTVDALNDLDLSYTPPLSSPWDPVQLSAQAWAKALRHASSC